LVCRFGRHVAHSYHHFTTSAQSDTVGDFHRDDRGARAGIHYADQPRTHLVVSSDTSAKPRRGIGFMEAIIRSQGKVVRNVLSRHRDRVRYLD
ncbi:MAG: hypothetical protein QG606_91, partial [Patescibacteria group bacterium]|nr:hypothetical protein [Patescibacteria group bacterium]